MCLTVSLGVSFSEYFSCCELSYFRYTVNDKRGLRGSNSTSVGYGNNRAFPNDKVISSFFTLKNKNLLNFFLPRLLAHGIFYYMFVILKVGLHRVSGQSTCIAPPVNKLI